MSGEGKDSAVADRWLHCNKCLTMAGAQVKFYFVSCGHIFCRGCCVKGSALSTQGACIICQKTGVRYSEISRTMNAQMKNLFRPPKDVAQECMAELQKVLQFQARHRSSLLRALEDQRGKAIDYAKKTRAEVQKGAQTRKELEEENCRLRNENHLLRSRQQQFGYNNNDFHSGAVPDSGVGTGDTSTFSFMEMVTSTPHSGISNSRRILADAFQSSEGHIPSPIGAPRARTVIETPDLLGLRKRGATSQGRTPRSNSVHSSGGF